jgi:hypothetical protein
MALIQQRITAYGVAAEYLKITEMKINWLWHDVAITVSLFVDKATRNSGAQPLETATYSFCGPQFPLTIDGNNLAEGYLALKQLEQFQDAGDDL